MRQIAMIFDDSAFVDAENGKINKIFFVQFKYKIDEWEKPIAPT